MVSRLGRIDKSAFGCFQITNAKSKTLSIPLVSYFVRIGSLAEIRALSGPAGIDRDDQVIIRTATGIQHGQVLGPCTDRGGLDNDAAEILRVATPEDRMLIRRLNRHKHQAVEKCRTALTDAGSKSILLDIDPSFDGQTLVLHFLGAVDSSAESISEQFAAEYEAVAQIRHFEKLLRDGCGPECGTDGSGCTNGTCSSCAAAVACKPNAS